MSPVWSVGDYVRVMRMKPSYTGKEGALVAGQLQDLLMTVKSVDTQGLITSIGAYSVRYLKTVDSLWGVFKCPKLGQNILVWVKGFDA